jgi:hypothetical protein
MTQEQSHPDQEGDTDNRRRRQSGQVTQQGALLSGRPAGLPTRTAARSAPALIGVTADEHWVIRHGPTYALLLIANQRPTAPLPVVVRANSAPPGAGRGAETFRTPSIPQEETAGNARLVRGAGAGRPARRPSGPEDGPEAHPRCRPESTTQSAACRPVQGALHARPGPPRRPTWGPRQTHPGGRRAAPTGARRPAWGRPGHPGGAGPAGRPGAARRPPLKLPTGPSGDPPAGPPAVPPQAQPGVRRHPSDARAGPAGGAGRTHQAARAGQPEVPLAGRP